MAIGKNGLFKFTMSANSFSHDASLSLFSSIFSVLAVLDSNTNFMELIFALRLFIWKKKKKN